MSIWNFKIKTTEKHYTNIRVKNFQNTIYETLPFSQANQLIKLDEKGLFRALYGLTFDKTH
jgi:hypothetical protein